jgi:hypothetical protein
MSTVTILLLVVWACYGVAAVLWKDPPPVPVFSDTYGRGKSMIGPEQMQPILDEVNAARRTFRRTLPPMPLGVPNSVWEIKALERFSPYERIRYWTRLARIETRPDHRRVWMYLLNHAWDDYQATPGTPRPRFEYVIALPYYRRRRSPKRSTLVVE